MPLSLLEILGMVLHGAPIGRIRAAVAKCEAAGVPISGRQFEQHHLAGGNVELLAEMLVTAHTLGAPGTMPELVAVALARPNPVELVVQAAKDRTTRFNTSAAAHGGPIAGVAGDGRKIHATISLSYRLSPAQLAFKFDFTPIHEALAAAVVDRIGRAQDLQELERDKADFESELRNRVRPELPAIKSVSLGYTARSW